MNEKNDPADALNPSYIGSRPDILRLLPFNAKMVLDVGCATGQLGSALKDRWAGAYVVGIEYDRSMADVASEHLDQVIVGDIQDFDKIREQLPQNKFDVIVCGDILEHVTDPWQTTRELADLLDDGAVLVASIPNIGHVNTHFNLLFQQKWPYRHRGIHDATHIRLFSLNNIITLFAQAGLSVVRLERNYRLNDQHAKLNRLARFLAVPGFRNLLTYQYLVVTTRESPGARPKIAKWSMP